MQDIIVGAVDNVNKQYMHNWVKSIRKCGFTGYACVIAYRLDADGEKFLTDNGIAIIRPTTHFDGTPIVYDKSPKSHVWQLRFFHIWQALHEIKKQLPIRYVICTDVKDVIFQTNPSDWLHDMLLGDFSVVAPSECIKYKHEEWNATDLKLVFGQSVLKEVMWDCTVSNAGTFAGKMPFIEDFILALYFMSYGKAVQGDMASFNFLTSILLKDKTVFADTYSAWAAQCGTMVDPTKYFLTEHLTCSSPIMGDDGIVRNELGEPFVIVHQYDRHPEWKQIIDRRYA